MSSESQEHDPPPAAWLHSGVAPGLHRAGSNPCLTCYLGTSVGALKKKEREKETLISFLPHAHWPVIEPITQVDMSKQGLYQELKDAMTFPG